MCISLAPAVDGPGRCSPAVTGLPPQSGHRAEWFSLRQRDPGSPSLGSSAHLVEFFLRSPRRTSCHAGPSPPRGGEECHVGRCRFPVGVGVGVARVPTLHHYREGPPDCGQGGTRREPGQPTGPFLGLCTASTCDATALCSRMGSKGLLRRGVKHGIGGQGVFPVCAPWTPRAGPLHRLRPCPNHVAEPEPSPTPSRARD